MSDYPMGIEEDINNEIWKPCIGFETKYLVSNLGRVKSIGNYNTCKKGIISPMCDRCGYFHVRLYDNNKSQDISVHRLVALAFIPNPNNFKYVNHKNKNTKDNRAENLEWCTNSYNIAYSIGKPVLQYTKTDIFIKEHFCITNAYKETGIPVSNIVKCCKLERKSAGGFKWKYKYD